MNTTPVTDTIKTYLTGIKDLNPCTKGMPTGV